MHTAIFRSRPSPGLTLALLLPLAAAFAAAAPLAAQGVTVPPSGDNQAAEVKQWIGPIELSVSYHSPDVT